MANEKITLTHKDDPDDVIAKVNAALKERGLRFAMVMDDSDDDGTQEYVLEVRS